jgi:hypothetical protein
VLDYYCRWVRRAFGKPLVFVQVVALILSIVVGIVTKYEPSWLPTMNILVWLIPLVILGGAVALRFVLAPFYIHKEEIEEMRTESREHFYRTDPELRRNRAYFEFYKLWEWGTKLKGKNNKNNVWTQWDKEVIRIMDDLCNETCLDLYLLNTGRTEGVKQLPPEKFLQALDIIKRMLDYGFDRDLK